MIVLFKYYCFHEVEKTSLGYMQVPPHFFFFLHVNHNPSLCTAVGHEVLMCTAKYRHR